MWSLLQSLFGGRAAKLAGGDVQKAIEAVIDGTDPRLRLVSGYRRKLRPAVERSLGYVDSLVRAIPGPLVVNRRTFGADPQVNALFSSVEHLREVCGLNHGLQEFFARPENLGCDYCYAFLVMNKEEKTTLGSEVDGDRIKRDVKQVTVNFKDHRIVDSDPTEEGVRRKLRDRAFNHLVTGAARQLVSLQSRKMELLQQASQLRLKLRILDQAKRGLEFHSQAGDDDQVGQLQAKLKEVETQLRATSDCLDTLDDYLERVKELLAEPQNYCGLKNISMRINRLGIKLPEGSNAPGEDIVLSDIYIGEAAAPVGIIVKYPRDEMQEAGDRLRKAEAYMFW